MINLTTSGYFINKAQTLEALPRLAQYSELMTTYQVEGYQHDLLNLLQVSGLVTADELRHIQANAVGLLFTEPTNMNMFN